jgi:predicted nucleic acid-binding protein
MPKKIVADSGFWFALFNERDTHHDEAQVIEEELSFHVIVVPWPTLYESINTRFMRRHHNIVRFKKFLEKSSTVLLEDDLYRKPSLEFILSTDAIKEYSLVCDQVDAG